MTAAWSNAAESVSLGIVLADFSLRNTGDASVPVAVRQWGQGRAHRDTLEELILRTRDLHDQTTAVIWAVHFPPRPPGESGWMNLINGEELLEAARASGVRHVLAGHIHRDFTYQSRDQRVSVLCANSACSCTLDEGNGFQILEIDVGDDYVRVVERGHIWDDDIGEFVAT